LLGWTGGIEEKRKFAKPRKIPLQEGGEKACQKEMTKEEEKKGGKMFENYEEQTQGGDSVFRKKRKLLMQSGLRGTGR